MWNNLYILSFSLVNNLKEDLMVYKRYARKNGKVYGPYYYESYRENGVVKKVYIGQKPSSNSVVPRSNFPILGIISSAIVALIVLAGILLVQPTGKVTLETQPSYGFGENLGRQVIIGIEEGDSIQKDTPIKFSLSKNGEIISESTLTFEEFLSGQVDYIPISNEIISCENVTMVSEREVCSEQINENNESVQVCINETAESVEENCTTSNTTDYYYQTPGSYSKDLGEILSYNFSDEGEYVLELEISSLGVSDTSTFSISAPASEPPANETEDNETVWREIIEIEKPLEEQENVTELLKEEIPLGIFAAPTQGIPVVNSSTGMNSTSEDLTVWPQNVTDPDSDPVTNISNWYINNQSITLLNMPFESNISSVTYSLITDYSSYLNNGTLGGNNSNGNSTEAPIWTSSGRNGSTGAYVFDGIDDYLGIDY